MSTSEGQSGAPVELRTFIDGMPALAWSCRPDGFPELVNQRFLEYSGLSPDQIYEGWKSTLHPDDVEVFEKWWQGLQNSPKTGQTEVRFRRVDGEYRWFQISAAPIHDELGNLIRWCGINIDIDDRKRAEQKKSCARSRMLFANSSWSWRLMARHCTRTGSLWRIPASPCAI